MLKVALPKQAAKQNSSNGKIRLRLHRIEIKYVPSSIYCTLFKRLINI